MSSRERSLDPNHGSFSGKAEFILHLRSKVNKWPHTTRFQRTGTAHALQPKALSPLQFCLAFAKTKKNYHESRGISSWKNKFFQACLLYQGLFDCSSFFYLMAWSYVALCSNFFVIHQRCSYVPGCQSVLVFYVFVWVSFTWCSPSTSSGPGNIQIYTDA